MKRFDNEDLAMALRLHSMALRHDPQPGLYYCDREGRDDPPTPFPDRVHLLVWVDEFLARVGGKEAFADRFAWIPTWEDGCAWLLDHGVPAKHIYSTVKEGVLFYEERELQLLHGEIQRILELDGPAEKRGEE